MEQYIKQIREKLKNEKYYENYLDYSIRTLKKYIEQFEINDPSDINYSNIIDYYIQIEKKSYLIKLSFCKAIRLLIDICECKQVLKDIIEPNLLSINKEIYTDEFVLSSITNIESYNIKVGFLFAYELGLSINQIIKLKTSDFNTNAKTINTDNYILPVPDYMADIITSGIKDNEYLLTGYNKKHISLNYIKTMQSTHKISIHKLRRTFLYKKYRQSLVEKALNGI